MKLDLIWEVIIEKTYKITNRKREVTTHDKDSLRETRALRVLPFLPSNFHKRGVRKWAIQRQVGYTEVVKTNRGQEP